jgi:hypothetical protein
LVGPPWWSDIPVFIVGGGASLSGFPFERLRGLGHVLGVNRAMFDAPCNAGVSIDHLFVDHCRDLLAAFAAERELYLAVGKDAPDVFGVAGARYLLAVKSGLSRDHGTLATGGTSGYAALNLAALKGARRVVLLGFDYGLTRGRHHYHDAYSWHHPANDQSWQFWAKRFDTMADELLRMGVVVINASPQSAIGCFRKMSIEDALAYAGT